MERSDVTVAEAVEQIDIGQFAMSAWNNDEM